MIAGPLAAQYNARLFSADRHDIMWVGDGPTLQLVALRPTHREAEPVLPADVARMNAIMRKFGCSTRYRPDGSGYDLAPGMADPADG